MTVIQAALGIGAVAFFVWLLIMPGSAPISTGGEANEDDAWSSRSGSNSDKSSEMGLGTGVMGGDFTDAAVSRYAMQRTKKDKNSSDARDLGNALGQQSGFDA